MEKCTEMFKKTTMEKMLKNQLPGLPVVLTHMVDPHQGQQAIVLSYTGLWLYPTIFNGGRDVPNWFTQNPEAAPIDYWRIYADYIKKVLDGLGI